MNKEEIQAKLAEKTGGSTHSGIDEAMVGRPRREVAEETSRFPERPRLSIRRLDHRVRLPTKAHPTDIGWDVYAHILTEHGRDSHRALSRYATTAIPTGLILRPPSGYFCQICSRSGWALQGVFVANSPGIIDPDYTGELKILLYNGSHETKHISHGMRIAQIILSPIIAHDLREITDPNEIPSEGRGAAGFGSSGL